jgi:hypothetical protein
MFLKTLSCGAVLVCAVLTLVGASAADKAGDKDKPALSGTWAKKDAELKIEFTAKNVLKIAPHGDSNVIAIVCAYTVDKGGRVKAKITGFEGKEEIKKKIQDAVPVGLEFSFQWVVKANTATLDDLKGDNVQLLKTHLEGAFEKK